MTSVDYYNKNAQAFFDRTLHTNPHHNYEKFLPLLPPKSRILDAGCGSGRDSLYFKNQGFDIVSFDASIEMVKLSSQLLGSPTHHLHFQEILFHEEFDAIWASASLLHIAYEDLRAVLQKFHLALKSAGILYASFKYGQGRRESDDRIFYDMNESSILPYLESYFVPIEIWTSPGSRSKASSPPQAWLNILTKKQ